MIFVTTGLQLPFPRLIKTIDECVSQKIIEETVICQTGKQSVFNNNKIKYVQYLSSNEFDEVIKQSSLVIAHAGIGTILKCIAFNKRLIVLPRKKELNEHRNDHQWATCEQLSGKGVFKIAIEENEIKYFLKNYKEMEFDYPDAGQKSSGELTSFIANYLAFEIT